MARPLRIHVPNTPYHLMSRGTGKQCIFEDETDHLRFLELLGEMVEKFKVACLGYCLLWNHYHLMVVPTLHSVSRFMHGLNSTYCQWFNRRHGRWGHVLGGRFKGPIVDSHCYLLRGLRYIALNPVASEHVRRPEDFRWSSYRAVIGLETAPAFLTCDRLWTTLDTDDPGLGRERFRVFVEAASVGEGWAALNKELFFGDAATIGRLDPLLMPHRKNPDYTRLQRFATRPPLDDVLDVPEGRARLDEAVRVAFCEHAYTLGAIGVRLGRPPGTIWNWVKRARLAKTRQSDVSGPVDVSELAATVQSRAGHLVLFE